MLRVSGSRGAAADKLLDKPFERRRGRVMKVAARRTFLILTAFAMALAATACGKEAAANGRRTYTVLVDAPSPEGKNIQFASFFPASLKVRPGDSIVFDNRSTQAPHTVSFGIKGDRSDQPANPDIVTAPCYTSAPPTATLAACPEKATGTPAEYAGKGFWNSGFLVPSQSPNGPKKVTMRLSRSIAPGTYLYLCILHRPMAGIISVVLWAAVILAGRMMSYTLYSRS